MRVAVTVVDSLVSPAIRTLGAASSWSRGVDVASSIIRRISTSSVISKGVAVSGLPCIVTTWLFSISFLVGPT